MKTVLTGGILQATHPSQFPSLPKHLRRKQHLGRIRTERKGR